MDVWDHWGVWEHCVYGEVGKQGVGVGNIGKYWNIGKYEKTGIMGTWGV